VISAAGPAVSPATTYTVWAHAPIVLASDDQLSYSFTIAAAEDGKGARNTDTYAFPSPTQPAVQSVRLSAADISGSSTTNSANAVDPTSIWNGAFLVDTQSCTPSDTCCCGGQQNARSRTQPRTIAAPLSFEFRFAARSLTSLLSPSAVFYSSVGLVNVSTTLADPSTVLLSGALDGGAGCLYQTSLTGLMSVNATNAARASRSIEIPNAEHTIISFTADLAPADGTTSANAPLTELVIGNSFRQCRTRASKVSAFIPDSSSVVEETDPTDTTIFAPNTTELARDAFVGDYAFDQSCVPSASCCCAQGQTQHEASPRAANSRSARTFAAGGS
jgi:hypothetical protein